MEEQFHRLIVDLNQSKFSSNFLRQIAEVLQRTTDEEDLSSFISQTFSSLIVLEHWTWRCFAHPSSQWFVDENFVFFLECFALWNHRLIFHSANIDADRKCSLLIPETTECFKQIFSNLKTSNDENDRYFIWIGRWFDNISYFLHEHSEFQDSPSIVYLHHQIAENYLLTDEYQNYLIELKQFDPQSLSIFTARFLFYVRTASFAFRMCSCPKIPLDIFQAETFLDRYADDYLNLILIHQHTISSWNESLLSCIAHLTDLICSCCWWGHDRAIYVQRLLTIETLFYDHIQGLIRILSHQPFHERIQSQWSNDETILIDSILIFLIGALVQIKNLSCFIRSESDLSTTLLSIAQKSSYDRISVCAYGILAEILSDQQLKEVHVTDNIFQFFFGILEHAWKHPTQRYKRITIAQLLTGFLTLSKNDAIQQKAAQSHKLRLFIEMTDQYPIVFEILWSLSFNHLIQEELRSDRIFMSKLTLLKNETNNERMQKTISGILWNLQLIQPDRLTIDTIGDDQSTFDIMISYSHKDELICKKIYEELIKRGFRVWIDFDQMHGNIMDAMVQGIEQSQMILICMSEQYRRSNYCRAEAHYAFQRQLRLVPILLQEHYQPDGWLLFLIGQLVYIDFTKHDFDHAVDLLIRELRASRRWSIQPIVTQPDSTGTTTVADRQLVLSSRIAILPENLLEWSRNDVQQWLIAHQLHQMAHLLFDFDGPNLLSLSEFMFKSDLNKILYLLQEDSLRRTNESISILELARFRTLLLQQTQFQRMTSKSTEQTRHCRRKKHSRCSFM